ncbi:MAG TPA: tetratricopeptide repeat protein [Planctomycetota bacterium]|nr:tetratricopeptide repeat protein [Planctomycetota bacterium]
MSTAHLGKVREALEDAPRDVSGLRRSLDEALARDPRRGDLHLARGLLLLYRDQEFEAARADFVRARELLRDAAQAELRAEARLEEARALELLGHDADARAAAGAALAGFPEGSKNAGEAAHLLARLEAARGELDLALAAHKRARPFYAAEGGPGLGEFHGFHAWLAEKRRDPRAWVRALRQLLAVDPPADPVRAIARSGPRRRARRLLRLLRRLERALLMAEEGGWADHDARADLAATLTFEGMLLYRLDRPARALKKLRKAIAREPASWLAHQLAGRCLLRRNRPVAATARLTRAAELAPRAAVLLDLARARERAGDLEGARATLETVARVEPRPSVLARLGRASEALDRKAEALEAYLAVTEKDARAERTLAARIGLLQAELGRDAAARKWLDRALQVRGGDPELLVARGTVLARLGHAQRGYRDLARAAEALESARGAGGAELATAPHAAGLEDLLAEARYQEGFVLSKLGRPADALVALDRCLVLAPEREDALLLKGDCARALGRIREAIDVWKELVDRKVGKELLREGVALYEEGKHVDALRKYREAFDRSPKGWEVFYRTAQAYARLGEAQPALKYLAIALKINRNVRMLLEKDPAVARLATAPELREALGGAHPDLPED